MFSKTLLGELNQKLISILGGLHLLSPALVLGAFVLLIILVDLIFKKKAVLSLRILSLIGLGISLGLSWMQYEALGQAESISFLLEMFRLEATSVFFQCIFLVSSILVILISSKSFGLFSEELPWGEYFAFILSLTLGLYLLAISVNLLMIYLALEFVSICSYMLTIFQFRKKGAEGAIKYLLFGAMSSGFMIYGMSLLYGFTGTLSLYDEAFLQGIQEGEPTMLLIIFLLCIVGLLFKISILPFHIWVPDVYEAAPTPVVAFFSVAPKAAGLLVLFKFSHVFLIPEIGKFNYTIPWLDVLAVLAMLTILVGNLSALWQNHAKRLLAYSSIAHAGFLLIGLVASSQFGLQSLLFYIGVYLCMNFGAFLFIELFASYYVGVGEYDIRNYQGLGLKYPFMGISITLIMIALTGLPPTAGFTAKLLIFSALWESYQASQNNLLLTLFVVGLLNTAISLFFYLKIPYYLFFKKPILTEPVVLFSGNPRFAQGLLAFFVLILLGLFFKFDWFTSMSDQIYLINLQP